MTFEEPQDASTQNVDETVNTVPQFTVHHWTEIKSSTYSVDYEMIFSKAGIPLEKYTGMVKTLNCCLNEDKTALGEKGISRLVHFDKSYLKFQICTLLRDLLFECDSDDVFPDDQDEGSNHFSVIIELIIAALTDYRAAHSICLDDPNIRKAIKPKTVTQHLKDVTYKP